MSTLAGLLGKAGIGRTGRVTGQVAVARPSVVTAAGPPGVRVWLPDAYGARAFAAQLMKGAGHKYIKRVPVGTTKGGATRYRYYYEVQHGSGIHNEDHFVEGAAFRFEGGHYHVEKVDGDTLTIKHDETGETRKVSRGALAKMLSEHHSKAIDAHKAKLKADLAATMKHGSAKQQARMKEHAAKWGVEADDGKAEPAAEHKAEAAKIVAKVLPKVTAKNNPRMMDLHRFIGTVTEAARKTKGYYNSDHSEAVQDAAAEAWKAAAVGGNPGDHIGDAAREYMLDHHAMSYRIPDAYYAEHLATTKLKDMVDATTRSHFLRTGTKPKPGQGVTAPNGSQWTVDSYAHEPFRSTDTKVRDAKGTADGMHRSLGLSVKDAVPHVLGEMNEHELKAIAEQVKGPMTFRVGKFDGHIGEMAAAELKRRNGGGGGATSAPPAGAEKAARGDAPKPAAGASTMPEGTRVALHPVGTDYMRGEKGTVMGDSPHLAGHVVVNFDNGKSLVVRAKDVKSTGEPPRPNGANDNDAAAANDAAERGLAANDSKPAGPYKTPNGRGGWVTWASKAEYEESMARREAMMAEVKVTNTASNEARESAFDAKPGHHVKSTDRMSNSGYHRSGKPNWWLRRTDKGDGNFVDIPRVRGDEKLDIKLDLEPGKYTAGAGRGSDGVRHSFTVPEKVQKSHGGLAALLHAALGTR